MQSEGNGAKHSLIVPNDATEYFTIKGKSFSKNISIELHKLVHTIDNDDTLTIYINSFPTDFISKRSLKFERSRIIF